MSVERERRGVVQHIADRLAIIAFGFLDCSVDVGFGDFWNAVIGRAVAHDVGRSPTSPTILIIIASCQSPSAGSPVREYATAPQFPSSAANWLPSAPHGRIAVRTTACQIGSRILHVLIRHEFSG